MAGRRARALLDVRGDEYPSPMSGAGYAVLLIEDDHDFALLTKMNLTGAGHAVTEVHSMHDALEHLSTVTDEIDVVLLDLGLPDTSGLDGLRAALESTRTPVVVLTGDARPSLRRAANDLGANAFLVKGAVTAAELDAVIRKAVVVADAATIEPRVGFAAFDDTDEAIASGLEIITASGGPEQWAFVRFVGGEPVVVVRTGPGDTLLAGTRLRFIGAIQQARDARSVHLGTDDDGACEDVRTGDVVPLGHWLAVPIEVDHAEHALLLGWGDDPHLTPAVEQTVTFVARQLATIQSLASERARATRRADIAGNAAAADALTGLGNRRAYEQAVRSEESRCRRYGHPAAVFVIDLDQLKVVNDLQGHAAGDRYLRAAAGALIAAVRDSDGVFRTGGDEFAIVTIECDVRGALQLEERIRDHLREAGVEASMGWAARPPEPRLESAASVADDRMYDDKSARRRERDVAPSGRAPAP